MNNELYRQEAIDNRNNRWSSKAFLPHGVPLWMVSTGVFIFLITTIVFLTVGTYTRRVMVSGEIISEPRAVTVTSAQQGYITKQFVHVGEDVKAGQTLYLLNNSKKTISGVVNETQKSAINEQILAINNILEKIEKNKATTIASLKKQIDSYNIIVQQTKENLKKAESGMTFMEKNMTNYRSYLAQGLVNKEQFINQTSLFYDRQNDLVTYKNQLSQYDLQIINLNSDLKTREMDFDNKVNELVIQRNDLQRQLTEVEANGAIVIPAPTSGRVESNSVSEGEMINAGDSLIQILPGSVHRYVLVLWVPAHAAPYITRGDKVNIRYNAFPADKFGQFPGRVISISGVPASVQEMATYPSAPVRTADSPETWYKLIVLPDTSVFHYNGKSFEFTNGMKATSILFLEKRKLYQWILSPIYDIKNSMEDPVNGI
ncbi:HlyD family secretion protein [Kosakonia sp. ML.JS2a]|uniref:HlyD family secretion protein n=1 Tax=Kosakonia sp. ML.JS2a TaxID=2980557 RepID=UPI0021D96BBC|nr:HlyD family secretion protein [Kosakonia sp. ML.JS2a]UXY13227.1 HlyD family secretion protein [Kosakonia sp. ML.JS2a]